MSAQAESLAKQFEGRAAEMTTAIERLTDTDWKKVTAAEKWSVGVTAHHVAVSHEVIAGIVKAVATGQSLPPFTMAMIDEMNAKHAIEHAGCTKTQTLGLHRQGAAAAAAVVRGLSDVELGRSATVLTGKPPMTTQQIVEGILIGNVDDHLGSIRATAGR